MMTDKRGVIGGGVSVPSQERALKVGPRSSFRPDRLAALVDETMSDAKSS